MTAPTSGLGFVRPSPFFASVIAWSIYLDSFETVSGIKKPRLNSGAFCTGKRIRSFLSADEKTSSIQTILSATESHRIMPCGSLARIFIHTAGGDLRPAPKFSKISLCYHTAFFFAIRLKCREGFSLPILYLQTDMNIVLSEFLC